MTSFKTFAILILGFAFLQATLASSHCQVQVYKQDLNVVQQEHMYIWNFGDIPQYYNSPYAGMSGALYDEDLEERTMTGIRAMLVDIFECGDCTVVGYSGKDLSGKSYEQYVDNTVGGTMGQVDFPFCVRSFTLDCIANHVEEEEIEEEEEEQEEEQQQ